MARPLYWFTITFHPFVVLLNGASNAILRMLRVDPTMVLEEGGTPEDLKLLIMQSLEGGHLDPEEALMLSGVFTLHEQQARQVMTPTPRVVTVDVSDDAGTVSQRCIESGHTRLPVTENSSPDHIRGVIHANSLLELIVAEGPGAGIERAVREALVVPETKLLDDLLAELRRTRNSIAVVVDEYGRTAGIVAVEDIVEEIVGEIADENLPSAGPVRQVADGEWLVRPARSGWATCPTTGSTSRPRARASTRSPAWCSTRSATCPGTETRSRSTGTRSPSRRSSQTGSTSCASSDPRSWSERCPDRPLRCPNPRRS